MGARPLREDTTSRIDCEVTTRAVEGLSFAHVKNGVVQGEPLMGDLKAGEKGEGRWRLKVAATRGKTKGTVKSGSATKMKRDGATRR